MQVMITIQKKPGVLDPEAQAIQQALYSLGFDRCYSIFSKKELEIVLKNALIDINSSSLIELKVRKGNRKDLGRPKESPNQNKKTFMKEWSKK